MSVPAIPVDIALAYNYGLEFQDLLVAYVRTANVPDRDTSTVLHAHAGQRNETKQRGKKKIGMLTIEKALPLDSFDGYFERWFEDGLILPPSQNKRDGIIYTLGSDNQGTIVMTWDIFGAETKSVKYSKMDGASEDALLLTVELEVDDCILRGV